MAEITSLELIRKQPQASVVSQLERMLEEAKAGTLRGIVAFEVNEVSVQVTTTGEWRVDLITWHCLRMANKLSQQYDHSSY